MKKLAAIASAPVVRWRPVSAVLPREKQSAPELLTVGAGLQIEPALRGIDVPKPQCQPLILQCSWVESLVAWAGDLKLRYFCFGGPLISAGVGGPQKTFASLALIGDARTKLLRRCDFSHHKIGAREFFEINIIVWGRSERSGSGRSSS